MSWLKSIAVADGIEEKDTERIVSYIFGDTHIQLAGFFTIQEISDLSAYLTQTEHHPPT